MEVIHRINRFGDDLTLGKGGTRRTLYGLDVHVSDPSQETDEKLERFNIDPSELREYQREILDKNIPPGNEYSYGNRMRAHFGGDGLDKIAAMLKKDPTDRYCTLSLWDTETDLIKRESNPCFILAHFSSTDSQKLMLTADFRTHNVVSAWLRNIYGLRAIQEYVSSQAGMQPGKINVKSRHISINPDDTNTPTLVKLVEKHRKVPINVNDPRGYFVISASGDQIIAEHHHPEGAKLTTYSARTAGEIKDQLRHDTAISDPDHAMWIGHELARAEYELKGEIKEL